MGSCTRIGRLLSPWALALAVASSALAQEDELGLDDDELGLDEATPSESEPEDTSVEPAVEPADEPAPAAAGEPGVRVQASVGLGFGTRALRRPIDVGTQRLPDTAFAAAEVALQALAWPNDAFALGFLLRYQTSVGLTVEEMPLFALPTPVDVRAAHAEASVAPTVRLGDSAQSLRLAFPVGFTLRTFWPEVHEMMTPSYSLTGPHLRVELIIPIGDALALRLGPEAQWIVSIDEDVRLQGIAAQGLALGGEAVLSLELGSSFAIELTYRDSHAFAASTVSGPTFEDVERFATGRFAGVF